MLVLVLVLDQDNRKDSDGLKGFRKELAFVVPVHLHHFVHVVVAP